MHPLVESAYTYNATIKEAFLDNTTLVSAKEKKNSGKGCFRGRENKKHIETLKI